MKPAIEFFFVPKQFLKPDPETEAQSFIDKIVSREFYKAVTMIAEKYSADYLITRELLIGIQQSQSTFSLYGICCHVFEGKGWAASQFTLGRDKKLQSKICDSTQ
jgi:hypothetical protein